MIGTSRSTPAQNPSAGGPAGARPGRPRTAVLWDRYGILGVLVLLVALMAVIAPNFFTLGNAFNIARATSINAILAAGMTLVILTRGIDLSVGSNLAVSGVVSVLLWTAGMPAPVCVLVGILVGALFGLVNGALVAYLALPAFIVTLGGLTYLRGTAYLLTDGRPLIADDLGFHLMGNGFIVAVPVPVVIMLGVFLALWFLLRFTRFGTEVYAIGGNPEAARLAGIRVKWTLVKVYVIAGACAGLAGVLFSARVMSGQPTAGETYELDAIAAVVLGGTSLLGGVGTVQRTLIGAMIMGVLSNGLLLMNVPFFYQLIIKGGVIVLAVAIDGLKNWKR
ncbi:ribose transport system permease protein [Spinactinospora alkalitolerans]|uniref:Ribose transport system permease protein n=1 Tax=Spinactinospora alkalitolerans TaxID=687207 RepID=A0A852TW22_9ACTN|nr:ABC transporter permease [Spinactinospora alkalitolerans]NYE48128.1 ribose transport system permease protein [Spinactinospora alkalitolerans]